MLLAATVGLGVELGAPLESEAQTRVPARLIWDGAVCSNAADFAARVGKRTNAVRFVQRGQRLVVRARIERSGDGLDARASIEARGRAPIVRHIESPDCDDALDALALVVAIGVEGAAAPPRSGARARRRPPRAVPGEPPAPAPPPEELGGAPPEVPETREESPPAESSPPAPSAAPPPVAPSEPLAAPPAADAQSPEPRAPGPTPPGPTAPEPTAPRPPVSSDPAIDSRSEPAPSELELGVGLSGALSIGVAPRPLLGGALWISVGWVRDSIWSPALVASAQHQRLEGLSRAGGRADFALSAGSLSLCPLRLGNASFALRPCASGAFGRLESEGYDTFDPRSSARPWGALGLALEGLARAGVIEFRAVLGATAPLSRDSFAFARPCLEGAPCSADVFHHVEPVIWSGALGAGVRVW